MDRGTHPQDHTLVTLFRENAEGLAGAVRGVLGPSADVGEVLQEAFLKAWKAGQAHQEVRDPKAWVFVITLNLAKDLRRRRALRSHALSLEEADAMDLATTRTPPGAGLEREEAVDAARAAILRLRDEDKEVFLMRVSAGLTFEAIAEALRIPVGTAKTRMRGALLKLRCSLSEFAPMPVPRREMP